MSSDQQAVREEGEPSLAVSTPSAYAVLYDNDRKFLVATKVMESYYFLSEGTGSVYYNGYKLPPSKGPGLNALPGGGDKENNPRACARREFREETGVDLPQSTGFYKDIVKSFEGGAYSGVYFRADLGDVRKVVDEISQKSLPNSKRIIAEIKSKKYTKYDQVIEFVRKNNISPWPVDNELERVECWNIADQATWDKIKKWESNSAINWYYHVLKYLRVDIFGLKE